MIIGNKILIQEIERQRLEIARLTNQVIDLTGQLAYLQGCDAIAAPGYWSTLAGEDDDSSFNAFIGEIED